MHKAPTQAPARSSWSAPARTPDKAMATWRGFPDSPLACGLCRHVHVRGTYRETRRGLRWAGNIWGVCAYCTCEEPR